MAKTDKSNFSFKTHDIIGFADAVEDREWLYDCFIDTGSLGILRNVSDARCAVVGRTGVGKSALLNKLAEHEDRTTSLDPESLALTYLSSHTSLSFYSDVGVKMDLFYDMLWRHILIIEVIKLHLGRVDENNTNQFLHRLTGWGKKNKSYYSAVEYLKQWSETFGEETEYRITEYTSKLETEMSKALEGGLGTRAHNQLLGAGIGASRSQAAKLTEEEKAQIVNHTQPVVDRSQIKDLGDAMKAMEEVLLTDRQKKCYIIIDRLDERWVNDTLRYRLIRSLFEAARMVNDRLSNVKVVFAIRHDLLERVFQATRDSGFQEEKYRSLHLRLSWEKPDLIKLLEERVNRLIRHTYMPTRPVKLSDILPNRIAKMAATDYLLERTLLTPRDAIAFLNACIRASHGKPKISQEAISTAESDYSKLRLKALGDEWSADYSDLLDIALRLLKGKNASFSLEDLLSDGFEDKMIDFVAANEGHDSGYFTQLVRDQLFERNTPRIKEVAKEILRVLHNVGLIGIKPGTGQRVHWAHQGKIVATEYIDHETSYYVHVAFRSVLGIR